MIYFFVGIVGIAAVMLATFLVSFIFAIGFCLVLGLKLPIHIPIGLAIIMGMWCAILYVRECFKKK